MKKKLLLVLTFGIACCLSSLAQFKALPTKLPAQKIEAKAPKTNANTLPAQKPTKRTEVIDGRAVTYIPIGSSENAYGFYGNPRTYLWADPNLNSLVFTHRYDNQIAYDISTDGGANWQTNIVLTNSADHAVGPPQGGILNPAGNTNPDDAHMAYFSLANENGKAGWTLGSNPLTETSPSNPITSTYFSPGELIRTTPSAFTTTQQGKSWYMGLNFMPAFSGYIYNGELVVGHASILNDSLDYSETTINFLAEGANINDEKIAFGPDGQTGYILIMSDSQSDPQPFTNYHPILLKTTDGGESWGNPIHVQLGGIDGIEYIKYYWPDTTIENLDEYDPGFNRNEVWYNMGFHADLIVDHENNPHITGIVALASEEGWYPYQNRMATWHIYSDDGGINWDADPLYNNRFMEGAVGDIIQYNRPYAASVLEGNCIFFSWLDTDKASAEDLNDPNIYVIGYDAEAGTYSEVQNVTAFGVWWFNAYFGSMSQYVLCRDWEVIIPFVFMELTGGDADPVNFWYIHGYYIPFPHGSFYCEPLMAHESPIGIISISQNQPNPANGKTEILVSTEEKGNITLEVSKINGQRIHQEIVNNNAQVHAFQLDVSKWKAGVYLYKVTIGDQSLTKKMVVQ